MTTPYFHPGAKRLFASLVLAGFPDNGKDDLSNDCVVVTCTGYAESSGNAWAIKQEDDGSISKGWLQMNSVHADILRIGDPFIYADCARMAKILYDRKKARYPKDRAKWFSDFGGYNSGNYKAPNYVAITKRGVSDFRADKRSLYIVASTYLEVKP